MSMSMFDQVFEITGGKSAEENPGYRLRLNSEHLHQLADESPGGKLLPLADVHSIRVYGYPIRLDETVTEMHLEPA